MKTFKELSATIKIAGEQTFELRDAFGNLKPLWNENRLGLKLLRLFRSLWSDPIDEDGQVKPGLGNHLSAYGLRIPYLLGAWRMNKVVTNLVTNAGFAALASRCNGSGGLAAFTYLAVGTSSTAANATDTTLGAEIVDTGLARAAATASRVTTTVTNDTAQLTYTWTASGAKAVVEAGAFNAASSGDLLGRQTFSAINTANNDTLAVTYKFKFS